MYSICSNLNIHVDVPGSDGYKFMTILDSCDLKQLVNQPTHLHGHILDLIQSPSDQDTIVDVQICDFIPDHALVKCSTAFPCQVTHIPNTVQYRICHYLKMSDFSSDLKDNSFVKSPANAVVNLYEVYVHDLSDVLDRHAPLVCRLTKILLIACVILIDVQSPWGANLKELVEGPKNPLNKSCLLCQIARCNALVNKDKSDY